MKTSAISAADSKSCTALHRYITEIIAAVQSKNQVRSDFHFHDLALVPSPYLSDCIDFTSRRNTACQSVEKPLSLIKRGRRGGRVDYNIKCNTKKYGHHTHFRVKCNYHKTKDTEVEYEVLYTFYTI